MMFGHHSKFNKNQLRLRNFIIFIAEGCNKIARLTPLCGQRYTLVGNDNEP